MVDSEIIFEYMGSKYYIQCKQDEKIKTIMEKFGNKIGIDKNSLLFLYNGVTLNEDQTFEDEAKKEDIERKRMNVIVYSRNTVLGINKPNNEIKKSKYIICPNCHENCRMSIINFKIILYDCKNKHLFNNIFLDEFDNTQFINESNIICSNCIDKNKSNSHDNMFYLCLTCDQQLCPLCNMKHNKEHKTIEYDNKNYICKKHNDLYFSYCKECKNNICYDCYQEHEKGHNYIDYKEIFPKKDKIKEELNELKNKKDKFNEIINEIIEKLEKIKKSMEKFYQINYDILENFIAQKKNYQILQNVNEINNNIKMNNIDEIISDDTNLSEKFTKILNIYDKIFKKEDNHVLFSEKQKNKNEIIEEEEDNDVMPEEQKTKKNISTKNIGNNDLKRKKSFISSSTNTATKKHISSKQIKSKGNNNNNNNNINNKNKVYDKKDSKKVDNKSKIKANFEPRKSVCEKIINNTIYNELNNEDDDENDILEPNEIILKYSINKSDKELKIFGENFVKTNSLNCTIKFEDKILKITEYLVLNKEMLKKEFLKIKLKAINLTNMSYMFHKCKALISLGDNSTLDTSKVTDMSYMFSNCNKLTSLNCIAKWNTSNVNNMSYMFFYCSTLKTLPDISNWDISNVIKINNIFEQCYVLSSLPDISKWNTSNIVDMSYMFSCCYVLERVPDISKWDISKVKNLSNIFYYCQKLKSLPDIEQEWDISNVEYNYDMFSGCDSLNNIPF